MKKFFLVFSILVVVLACTIPFIPIGSDLPTPVTVTTEPVVEEPKTPELSNEFIETALQFIDEYTTSSKELENLAAEAIQQSNEYRDNLYAYLNWYLPENFGEEICQFWGHGCDTVETVKVFIHNYGNGAYVGCVTFNGLGDAYYNYNHDKLILASGILGKKYPDNLSLAEARIAAYVISRMDNDQVDCCIITNGEGKKSYDFTFENQDFKETAREILQNLSKS